MSAVLEFSLGYQHPAHRALRAYLGEVAGEVGVGLESVTVDLDTPVSAYVALDTRLRSHPGRDVALLWDERSGWAIAVETHSGEDLIVLRYLGGTAVPASVEVARFVAAMRRGEPVGLTEPPSLRVPTGLEGLDLAPTLVVAA
ncbi:DUF6292 family protein [Actinokineospora globicatena]|uniref:DUF6292 family protein n=1 Tax=Actinokineospora globicatena TaxID=103729 RepID=UPI0020A4917A|nr:DUF6292 family protein [Actinokineospora globicatena]MCP2306594.1 hypothetical protein [Actinokineospora globicatena]GLW82028.1 hypothetical protein Aglo01_65090 [Actinokineospora globicatena]GLW88822.1 hypothetical protein Aglo02_64610 [Actinokineospora globicatena]